MTECHLDCKGLACPQPVLKCKDAIKDSGPKRILVTVDNQAAKDNVTRFLERQDYSVVHSTLQDECYEIDALSRDTDQRSFEQKPASPTLTETQPETEYNQLVLITSDTMGHGDDYLGSQLMQNFLDTLPEMGEDLWRIILINSGVKLAISGSPTLEKLRRLEDSGVSILVCGTCLTHFGLLEQNEVGEATNMLDVVTSLELASKVIKV